MRTNQWRTLGYVNRTAHTLAWPTSGNGLAFAVREGERDEVLVRSFAGETYPLFAVEGPPLAALTWSCGHAPHDGARLGS